MTLVRAAVLISAPIDAVYELALARAARPLPWLGPARLVEADPPHRFELAGARWSARRACWLVSTGAGTLLTDELGWVSPLGPAGWLADVAFLRRRLLAHLVTNAAELKTAELKTAGPKAAGLKAAGLKAAGLEAAGLKTAGLEAAGLEAAGLEAAGLEAAGPHAAGGRLVVVGAALFDAAGRVLAAQRSRPPDLAGRWEFPGGKVEPGESETAALIRECQEELGVHVRVGARLGVDLPVQGGRGVLRVWTGRITTGQPTPREHRALRWLAPDELDDVDWLPADRPLIDLLRAPARPD